MEPSKVYFTNLRVHNGDSLQKKLERLIRRAGIETIDFNGRYAAIKIHFGEPGNLAYLRPNYAKTVADVVKSLGGKPSSQTATPFMWAEGRTLLTISSLLI